MILWLAPRSLKKESLITTGNAQSVAVCHARTCWCIKSCVRCVKLSTLHLLADEDVRKRQERGTYRCDRDAGLSSGCGNCYILARWWSMENEFRN